MNDIEYKQRLINYFKSGNALMNDWDDLAEICIQASKAFSPQNIDAIEKHMLTRNEYNQRTEFLESPEL